MAICVTAGEVVEHGPGAIWGGPVARMLGPCSICGVRSLDVFRGETDRLVCSDCCTDEDTGADGAIYCRHCDLIAIPGTCCTTSELEPTSNDTPGRAVAAPTPQGATARALAPRPGAVREAGSR